MTKRWLSLFVENNRGVLAKIAGLFAGKAYNLESLTVGTTGDPTISRMTISLNGDDDTFEQIKKQLNRLVEVIKVIDITNMPSLARELLYIKISDCTVEQKEDVFRMAAAYSLKPVEYNLKNIILESVNSEEENNRIVEKFKVFENVDIVRGGSVAIEFE